MLTKLKIGNYRYSIDIEEGKRGTLILRFNYNPTLIEEIKTLRSIICI